MRKTRSQTQKDLAKGNDENNGHIDSNQSKQDNQPSVKYATLGATKDLSLGAPTSMTGRGGGRGSGGGGGGSTPNKKGKPDPLTLDSLADLIKQNHSKMGEIQAEVSGLKETVETWQEKTDTRLTALEKANTEVTTKVAESNRLAVHADESNAALQLEIATMRKEYKMLHDQLALTQACVIKHHREANELGREIKKYNIRFGKVAEPIIPPPTGAQAGYKAREDSKQVIVDFIGKHDLYPGKTPTQISQMIEVAYRTGSVEQNRVRQVLVKFHRLDDRRIIMVNGKKKERDNQLDGAYLQDDLTNDDMSKKRRSHAFMFKLKQDEKRPAFVSGRVKTLEGFIKDKDVIKYNTDNGIDDSRKKELTTDLLTLKINRPSGVTAKDRVVDQAGAQVEEGKIDQASGGAHVDSSQENKAEEETKN